MVFCLCTVSVRIKELICTKMPSTVLAQPTVVPSQMLILFFISLQFIVLFKMLADNEHGWKETNR